MKHIDPMFYIDQAMHAWSEIAGDEYRHLDVVHRAGVFLLMSIGRGNSYVMIARSSRFDRNECRLFKRRALENGIFVGRKIFCEWSDQKYGQVALMLDALTVAGMVKRT